MLHGNLAVFVTFTGAPSGTRVTVATASDTVAGYCCLACYGVEDD